MSSSVSAMKATSWAALAAAALWVSSSVTLSCGGDSESGSETPSGGKAGSGGSTSGGASGGAGLGGGGAGSGGMATGGSAGSAGTSGVGGAAGASGANGAAGASGSDPGQIACGAANCDVPDEYCCDDSMQPGNEKCVPSITSSCAGFRRMCDEAADCEIGNVCCTIPAAATFYAYNTSCAPSCDTYFPQLCKTSAECTNGQACVSQTCNGWLVQTCGPIPAQLTCS
jgi:hypothetical protein